MRLDAERYEHDVLTIADGWPPWPPPTQEQLDALRELLDAGPP